MRPARPVSSTRLSVSFISSPCQGDLYSCLSLLSFLLILLHPSLQCSEPWLPPLPPTVLLPPTPALLPSTPSRPPSPPSSASSSPPWLASLPVPSTAMHSLASQQPTRPQQQQRTRIRTTRIQTSQFVAVAAASTSTLRRSSLSPLFPTRRQVDKTTTTTSVLSAPIGWMLV